MCLCFAIRTFPLLANITRKHFNYIKNLFATDPLSISLLCTEVEQEWQNYCQKNPQTVPLDGDLNCCVALSIDSLHWGEFPLLDMMEPTRGALINYIAYPRLVYDTCYQIYFS